MTLLLRIFSSERIRTDWGGGLARRAARPESCLRCSSHSSRYHGDDFLNNYGLLSNSSRFGLGLRGTVGLLAPEGGNAGGS